MLVIVPSCRPRVHFDELFIDPFLHLSTSLLLDRRTLRWVSAYRIKAFKALYMPPAFSVYVSLVSICLSFQGNDGDCGNLRLAFVMYANERQVQTSNKLAVCDINYKPGKQRNPRCENTSLVFIPRNASVERLGAHIQYSIKPHSVPQPSTPANLTCFGHPRQVSTCLTSPTQYGCDQTESLRQTLSRSCLSKKPRCAPKCAISGSTAERAARACEWRTHPQGSRSYLGAAQSASSVPHSQRAVPRPRSPC